MLSRVHIVEWPVTVIPGGTGWLTGEQYAMARRDIDEAIAEAGGGSAAEVSIVEGSIVGTLCRLSADASMIVLGARGRGGFASLMIGSVSLSVTVHAKCPVVVVRGEGHADAATTPVVAGVDESPQAKKALEFALTEAELRGSAVLAVREFRYGSLYRTAHLPAGAEKNEIQAHYDMGIFEVTVPLGAESKTEGHPRRSRQVVK